MKNYCWNIEWESEEIGTMWESTMRNERKQSVQMVYRLEWNYSSPEATNSIRKVYEQRKKKLARWQNTQRYLEAANHWAQIGLIQKEHRNLSKGKKKRAHTHTQNWRRMKETLFSEQHISEPSLRLNEWSKIPPHYIMNNEIYFY